MPCRYKPCPYYGSHWSYLFFVLLLTAGAVGAAQPAGRKLLSETAFLDRADGKLLHVDANDTWLFELTMEVKTPDYRLAAGTRFVLLPSAALGRLVADVNDRVAPRYRLSARVTLYRGKNYLFPTYYLPLSKFNDEKSTEDEGQKTEGSNPPSAVQNPKPTEPPLAIPPEVLERLKKQRPLRGPRKGAEAERKPIPEVSEQVLVDCVGRIETGRVGNTHQTPGKEQAANGGHSPPYDSWIFVPYALGWNIGAARYKLLPCTVLEEVLRRQKAALDPLRFNVAGLVTEFQGRKYLLLQRAIVVYNYGNFGR